MKVFNTFFWYIFDITVVKNYKDLLNKSILFTVLVVIIVGVFPRASSFKYEIQPSKPWQYGTLLAPFDFAIKKSQSEFEIEINEKMHSKISNNFI